MNDILSQDSIYSVETGNKISNNTVSSMIDIEIKEEITIESKKQKNETLNKRNENKHSNKKTKKRKQELSKTNKDKMWDIFESDKKEISSANVSDPININYSKGMDSCYQCNSHLIIMDDKFPTCSNKNCGIIYTETLDYSPEWRFHSGEDKHAKDPTRCGNPINPLLVESSFGCKVLCSNKSSYEMKRIRKWTEWQSMPHREKALYDEFQFITTMAQNSGIPKIFIDDAIAIHKDISEQKMFRGMNRDGIKAASHVAISCRLNGCPRTAHEIAEIFKLDKIVLQMDVLWLSTSFNIERNVEPSQQTELGITLPSSFIERYCSRLNINQELTCLALFVAKKVEQNDMITDNIPHAIASGIVYFVSYNCGLNISKQDIRNMCGVSEVTINKCFKKLELLKKHLIPDAILNKYAA